jgi:hypothetical protein
MISMTCVNRSPRADDDDSLRELRRTVAELERRLYSLAPGQLRHDVGNTIGAARNALSLIDEDAGDPVRLLEIAQRNVVAAERMLAAESGGDERDDLGSAGHRDHGSTLGL